ncbi:hypothetical protein Natpe_3321 [Natrinema pellirubrum DSM 15624]|uniref:Uncharacterized protein n=1 Tax=Natrinema pellirubrum (strain DSM 15624 / CIP 106293 / JCM 10476 / NCIMB 786 / 157) TaxID=797303 RepID=L0JQK3_NATP1|nr:hypothetical protein [Natrinema pellirubrum]AGB33108.1 hypothetical protein Natpe_3321 [Natrinema pellirubrum DSM 15624]
MSQSDGRARGVVGRDVGSNWLAGLPAACGSAEARALVVIALLLFSLMALGNLAGLW